MVDVNRRPELLKDPTAHIAVNGEPRSEGPIEHANPTTVYYLHNKNHVLLYVGISSRALTRFSEHRRDQEWWDEVAYASMEHFPNRIMAEQREAAAINHLNPRYNVRREVEVSQRAINSTARVCRLPDCERTQRAKGLCAMHYHRQWRKSKEAS